MEVVTDQPVAKDSKSKQGGVFCNMLTAKAPQPPLLSALPGTCPALCASASAALLPRRSAQALCAYHIRMEAFRVLGRGSWKLLRISQLQKILSQNRGVFFATC